MKEDKKIYKKKIKNFCMMTIGSLLYAGAVSSFLDPNALAPGGITGISIILNRIFSIETGTWIFLLNIPIFILGAWKFGGRFIISTIYCTALVSVATNYLVQYGAVTRDSFLAAVTGGGLTALGIGLVFKAGATTGGMDIVVKVLRTKIPHLKTGSLYLMLDLLVVVASAIAFRDVEKALYSAMTVFLTSFLLDMVLYGRDGAKLIYIISDHSEVIARRMLDELNIGVTYVQGYGAYSGKQKNVIMCVIRKQLSPKAEEIVKEEDPMSFMIVSSATEIYGEGYKNILGERL